MRLFNPFASSRPALVAGIMLAAALVVWMGFRMAEPPDSPATTAGAPKDPPLPPPTTISRDATEVFQRAFWKRPTEKDRIMHAERREWADGAGVDRWQWFIAVDPSEQLARYLHEQNPFSMSEPKGKTSLPAGPRPEWFPDSADGFTVRQTLDGQMLLLIQPNTGRLFATSQGRGFARPAEMPRPAPMVQTSSNPGRLPTTAPPIPPKP